MASAGDTGPLTGTLTDYTLGGETNLLGDTWTPAEINSSDFNVTLEPRVSSGGLNASVYIDYVAVTIYTNDGNASQAWTSYIESEEVLQP